MERNHEPVLPNLVKWNSSPTSSFILDSSINLQFYSLPFNYHSSLHLWTFKMFAYLQHVFNFLHLQENLLYIQSQKPIAPYLIYHILSVNSVFIRSTYSLNANALLVDLRVPTGELDFDLALDFISACKQYVWTYRKDTYILDASKANDLLQNPRIIQDYSFYLVEGYMPAGSPLQAYQILYNFYHLSPMESIYLTPIQFLGGTKLC